MQEFVGSDVEIARQRRVRDRMDWIAKTPGAINAGRLVNFDSPERVGWKKVHEIAEEDGLVGFPGMVEEEIVASIAQHLGEDWNIGSWLTHSGRPEEVLPKCEALTQQRPLPAGWRFEGHLTPGDEVIGLVQELNLACDVSPYPAYYSRGEVLPNMTAMLWNGCGRLMATASACMRFHAESRLGGCLFVGLVSVAPTCRGQGIGSLINAMTLLESHKAFGWLQVQEQAHADNRASRRMIEVCGLDRREALVAVAASRGAGRFTK